MNAFEGCVKRWIFETWNAFRSKDISALKSRSQYSYVNAAQVAPITRLIKAIAVHIRAGISRALHVSAIRLKQLYTSMDAKQVRQKRYTGYSIYSYKIGEPMFKILPIKVPN